MNYQIVADKEKLLEFIEWLPELQPNETFYLSLLARNKYLPDRSVLKADKCSLKRLTTDKKYMFRKIKQMECEIGAYEQDGIPICQKALVLYLTTNPRNMEQAAKNGLIKLAQCVTQPYNGYNPHQLILSELQRSVSRKVFYGLDVDGRDYQDFLAEIEGKINFDCLHILKTKGGFHCLVEFAKMDKKYEKSWYKNLSKVDGVDIVGDMMSPVAGCLQAGDFVPHFVKI